MGLAMKTYEANVKIMDEKSSKAMAALSALKKIDSDEDEKIVRHVLGRVRATFEEIQKMRKDVTGPLDAIKSELMEFEKRISTDKNSNSEYIRGKKMLDQYANKKAADAAAEQLKIQLEKDIKLEEANIKSQLIKSIELGVFDLVKEGEIGLTKFVAEMTSDNYDEKLGKLNYKPKLKPDAYSKLMQVDYNRQLITVDKFTEIIKVLGDKFEYDNVNAAYSEQALIVLEIFKKDVIPLRKIELDERAKSSADEQKIKAEQDKENLKAKLEEVDQTYESEKKEVVEKAEDKAAESMIDAEFEAQVSLQQIDEQKGVRKNLCYSLNEDALSKPSALLDTMVKVMTHVIADAKFKGIVKRDSQGFPKLDSDGKVQYVDGINYWLKELAKLGIDTDKVKIPNLDKIEDVSTIVRA